MHCTFGAAQSPASRTTMLIRFQATSGAWQEPKTSDYKPKNGLFLFQTSQAMERTQSPMVAE